METLEAPTIEHQAHGRFERDFVTHAETNTKAMAYRNRESTILEKWIREGGNGFEEGACRVIAGCLELWRKMGCQRVTARYGERMPSGAHDDGLGAHAASEDIDRMRGFVPSEYWRVFENVVRFNQAAGQAGADWASYSPQQIHSAKLITGMVASVIAMRLGY